MEKFFVSRLLAVVVASTATLILAACGGGGGSGGAGSGSCNTSVPPKPFSAIATPGNGSATVSWLPNSGPIPFGYVVTLSPGNVTQTVSGSTFSLTVNGLTNGTAYTFTVAAQNCAGTSPALASNTVIPEPPPGAPTGVTVALGTVETTASVSFTPPTTANPIILYTVTSSPGNLQATGTLIPITITGLSNNTAYTFTVTATNAVGTSLPSNPSNSVTEAIAYTGPFYVSASAGSDTNNGSSGAPFKTITQGLAVAKSVGKANTVNLASGGYGNNESFPIMMVNNVNLVGAASAVIAGFGPYTTTSGPYGAALVFPRSVTAAISGVTITNGIDVAAIADSGANATVTGSNLGTGTYFQADGMYVMSGASATVTASTIAGNCGKFGGLYATGSATVSARGSTFSDTCNPAVLVSGGGTALTSPTVDLGTATSPGANVINGPGVIGGATGSVGLSLVGAFNTVFASGDTWHPGIQGATNTGAYTVNSPGQNPAALVIGNNYAITSSAGGLRF